MKQPYLDWIKTLPNTPELEIDALLTIEELNRELTTYLIPEILDDSDFEVFVERAWSPLFEMTLASWTTEKKVWPKKRTQKMFHEWFDVKCSSLVVDLWSEEPLEYAE